MTRGFLLSFFLCALGITIPWAAGGNSVAMLASLALSLQVFAWIPATRAQDERFYDFVGSLTYLMVVGVALQFADTVSMRAWIVAMMVVTWAVRLGSMLLGRALRGGDRRFDEIKTDPARFLVAWCFQGLWVAVVSLPATWAITRNIDQIGVFEILGWSMWAVGFGIEVVADGQKKRFRADPANADAYITTGLWARSRHPNYFGEILLWTGLFVSGIGHYNGTAWLTITSPLLTYILLTRVSGIPMLEKRADRKWADDPEYVAYRDKTPVLIPRL